MRAPIASVAFMSFVVAGWLCESSADAAMCKCVFSDGRVTYQDFPCQSGSSETSLKVVPAAPPASALNSTAIYVAPVPRSMYESAASHKIPKTIDARRALETWARFGKAFNRGDRGR